MINASCEGCALCCKLFLINLSEKEFYSGMFRTELTTDEYFEDFEVIEECGLNILKKNPDGSCVYLKDQRCSIYKNRPQVCRDFFCGSDKPEFEGMAEEINIAKRENEMKIKVNSEIGKLEGVILHSPGPEIENMTPKNAERALYSDILNLSVARKEYRQFNDVLDKFTKTYQVKDLLTDILKNEKVKSSLVSKIYENECVMPKNCCHIDKLLAEPAEEIARQLIEGRIMEKNTLTNYLDEDRYSLKPLHNFFFTRDAAVSIYDTVHINRMANKVRERESNIMEAIFDNHPEFQAKTVNPLNSEYFEDKISLEGGDVLVFNDNIILIGNSARTTPQGIDYILYEMKKLKGKHHIIVQELPYTPESFIHLDMVFTMLDRDKCMVYKPLILDSNRFLTIQLSVDNGKVTITEENSILSALKKLGHDLKPIFCGGNSDTYIQEREQWHSGANFFAIAPGQVIGYGRNVYTLEEMNKNGFEVLRAKDILSAKIEIEKYDKFVITVDGSELARGGGGCRCMTMPVRRKKV